MIEEAVSEVAEAATETAEETSLVAPETAADADETMAEASCRRSGRSGDATAPEMARRGRRWESIVDTLLLYEYTRGV
jgi:hypothetical protein